MAGKRRAANEGSVFQLSNGRWVAMIELPRLPNGKRVRRKREARTQAEAQAKLKAMRRDLDEFETVPKLDRTVSQTLDDYVDQVLASKEAGWSTEARNDGFNVAIVSHLGDLRTAKLTVADCDAFLAAFASGRANASGRPVGRDYVRRLRSHLINVLRNDMRLGFINRNVAELAVLPPTPKRSSTKRALTVEEWRLLYDAASGTTKLSIDLSGRHGLRPQETRALRWAAVDLEAGTVSVVNQFDSDDRLVDPKTTDSTRTIKLHAETVALLAAWQAEQDRLRSRPRARWTERGLVLTTKVGTAISQENYRRSIRLLCVNIGIDPITPYELRHTAITHQVDIVGSAGPVADWAGTSEAMIRQHYRHKLRETNRLSPPDYRDDR